LFLGQLSSPGHEPKVPVIEDPYAILTTYAVQAAIAGSAVYASNTIVARDATEAVYYARASSISFRVFLPVKGPHYLKTPQLL
jgi:hypothetical protein